MSITYTWFIDQIKTAQIPEANFVTEVNWGVRATDGVQKFVVQSNLSFNHLFGVFVPYEQLTEEMVIGWVKEKLGAEMVADYENSLEKQIKGINKIPSLTVTPLPWAQP